MCSVLAVSVFCIGSDCPVLAMAMSCIGNIGRTIADLHAKPLFWACLVHPFLSTKQNCKVHPVRVCIFVCVYMCACACVHARACVSMFVPPQSMVHVQCNPSLLTFCNVERNIEKPKASTSLTQERQLDKVVLS